MIIDFLIQGVIAAVFFLGIVGVGLLLLRAFRFQDGNIFFDVGVAYFVSLCLYTVGSVSVLFLFPWKITALQVFTILYGATSVFLVFRRLPKNRSTLLCGILENKFFLITGLVAVSLFFLQIYHTSILDEWLHRPVVKSFTENGVFPLVNPLSPDQDFIHAYHYGTQIVSSAIQVLTRIGVSESMDVFKLSYFVAAFVLFYGILLKWIGEKREAVLGAFFALFAGSSFFLLDAFSVSHIWRLKWIESEWPLNVPPAYTLSGITWVNIVLSVAFIFLLEHVTKNLKGEVFRHFALLGVLFAGFFLISEIFALLLLGIFIVVAGWRSVRGSGERMRIATLMGVFLAVVSLGVYYTGGITGAFIENTVSFSRKVVAPSSQLVVADGLSTDEQPQSANSPFSFRAPKDWGYPAEKKILTVLDYPFLYIRNFLLEIFLLALFAYAVQKKKVELFEYPILSSAVAVGFLLPFFFSTSYGTLNLTKLTAFSLMALHLAGFAILFRAGLKKTILVPMLALFIFAAIPGTLIGTNMQWKWISTKGKEQACSQNPLCYKGEFTDILRKFEKEYPGLKKIVVDQKNAKKVVDLTSSYIYKYGDKRAEYIVDTPELQKYLSEADRNELTEYQNILFESGEYRILRVK